MKQVHIALTTDASGDATVTTTPRYTGFIEKVELNFGTLAADMDFAMTIEGSTSQAFLTVTDQAAADAVWYPRVNLVDGADAAAFAAENAGKYYLANEALKVTVAQGGNAKSGEVIITLSDG